MTNWREIFESMPANSNGLLLLFRALKLSSARTKSQMVDILVDIYSKPDFVSMVYYEMTDYEKDLISYIIRCNQQLLASDLNAIAMKHGYPYKSENARRSCKLADYFPLSSKLYALMADRSMPSEIELELRKLLPIPKAAFLPALPPEDWHREISGRENQFKDFDIMLQCVNINALSSSKQTGNMTKASVQKFLNKTGFIEIVRSAQKKLKSDDDFKGFTDTTITFGIAQLLLTSEVLCMSDNKYMLGSKALEFSEMTTPEKARFLYDSYLASNSINELDRICGVKLRYSYSFKLHSARRKIAECLSAIPVNNWVKFSDISEFLRLFERSIINGSKYIQVLDERFSSFITATWNDFEHLAINISIMEYFAVLGAVDVKIDLAHREYGDMHPEITHVRLTELGAWLFGIQSDYKKSSTHAIEGNLGFIVQPNFDIVVQNKSDRLRHELFFDRFCERASSDFEVTVYKLNFKAMAKALALKIPISEIISYCESFSSVPIPDNVRSALNSWDEQSKRIKIRLACIIESDDIYLLEEVKNYKGMEDLTEGKIATSIILKPNNEMKVKSLIEKNNRFCVIE
ncbi:MAG: helicase-associated domain-containing protein [Clostridiales bacterium]|jgi:hypothetical protein|nr:helicase-associated domain-containing protein [Clostridiales bacterium]